MLPISICLIAKNEETYLEECLKRLSPLQGEIIVADTGSTDRTPEIASAFTQHFYSFCWSNDFSAARNFAVSKASHDWILSVDCDEFAESLDSPSFEAWFYKNCISRNDWLLGRFSLKNICSADNADDYTHESVTRFFNRRYYRFDGAVHEQLVSLTSKERFALDMPLSFLHMGYADGKVRRQKALRNLELLFTQLQQTTPSCYLYYQLGQCYFSIQDYENAIIWYEKALSLANFPFPGFVQTLMEAYGYCLLEAKRYDAALALLSEDFYAHFCSRADYVFLAGLIYMNNGFFTRAKEEFLKAVTIPLCRAKGTNSFKAYYNAGVICECTGDISNAICYYKKCGQYLPAQKRLHALMQTPPSY